MSVRNIAVLVSGGGTNLQALLDAEAAGAIRNGRIVRVISSKPGVFALDRAKRHGIETAVVERKAKFDIWDHPMQAAGRKSFRPAEAFKFMLAEVFYS